MMFKDSSYYHLSLWAAMCSQQLKTQINWL